MLGGAFIGWTFLSFSFNFEVDIWGPSVVETLNFAYGYLMFVTVVLMVRDWERWRGCLNGWLWGAVVVCFFGVWAVLGNAPAWAYDDFSHRVASTLRLANQLPAFLLPLFVTVVFMIVRRRQPLGQRWALLALLVAMFLTAIGTGSRSAFLMLIVAALGILYVARREARRRAFDPLRLMNMALLVFAGLAVYILLALANHEGDYALGRTPAWQRPVVTLFDWSEGQRELDTSRQEQLKFVAENFGNHPFFGTGPKAYSKLYGVEEIHNTYAGVLIQTGLVGLALFLCWLGQVLWLGKRASKRIMAPDQRILVLSMVVGMVLLLLYGMTMFGLRQRNLWLLAGLLVAADGLAPRTAQRPGGAPGFGRPPEMVVAPGYLPRNDSKLERVS